MFLQHFFFHIFRNLNSKVDSQANIAYLMLEAKTKINGVIGKVLIP